MRESLDFARGESWERNRILCDLKKDNLPVIIYGTGKFARSVAEAVIDNDIQILCFLDEDEYWELGKELIVKGRKIRCINRKQVPDIQGSYNILLGMLDYSLLQKLKREFAYCHYIEYLDVYSNHKMSSAFLAENSDIIKELYTNLEDEESCKVLEAYLYARYTGDVKALCGLVHDARYLYDWDLLALSKQDIVVDGGAYTGDSILEMREYLDGFPNKIFAFEPDKDNFMKLSSYVSEMNFDHVRAIESGLFSSDTILHFASLGTVGSTISDDAEGNTISVQALDGHSEYKEVTLIKMDIEGSELEALNGCKKLLEKNSPRLAVCVYHKNEDIIDIYKFLKQFTYNFYLRQHSASVEETVIYAIK